MDNFKFNNLYNYISESTYINSKLDHDVFQFPEDSLPILQYPIKLQIEKYIKQVSNMAQIRKYYISGEILKSDESKIPINVIIEIDPKKYDHLTLESILVLIKSFNKFYAIGTQHPLRFILTSNKLDSKTVAYDPANEKWLNTNNLLESIIDYSHKNLPPHLWDVEKNPPVLKKDIKKLIINTLKKYLGDRYNRYVNDLHITGSIGTTQWNSNTDIDIHIIPKDIETNKEEYQRMQKNIKQFFDKKGIKLNGHPFEVYLQLEPSQELRGDACYDVFNDIWLKGPLVLPDDFDPKKEFSYLDDELDEIFSNFDLTIGELKRDIIDYNVLYDYFSKYDDSEREYIENKLKGKIDEIEQNIDEIIDIKMKYHKMRKSAYEPVDISKAKEDALRSQSWKPSNVLWKMIDRYKYVTLALALQKIKNEDDGFNHDDIKDIEDKLSLKEYISEKKNEHKDPLKAHKMKINRGFDRKNLSQVPYSHQHEAPIQAGQRQLEIAKDAESGLWRITPLEALFIAKKYKMHVPTRNKPFKHLGSTKILMWKRGYNEYFLVKDDKFKKSYWRAKQQQKLKPVRFGSKKSAVKRTPVSADTSKVKRKKTRKKLKTRFKKHHTGTWGE